jgi:ABC-2 type transport system permease protein
VAIKRRAHIAQILCIAVKDARIYFFKAPNLTFGLFLPLVLYWAFVTDRAIDPITVMPGLLAVAIFFGAGAIQSVALPLERRTGTMYTLLATPITTWSIALGKALAGLAFGLVLTLVYLVGAFWLTRVQPNLGLFALASLFSSLCFSAFGLFLAAPFRDVPQAMPPATVIRIVMVFLSGTFAPLEGAWTSWPVIARLLPLTYGVDALRQAVNGPVQLAWFAADLAVMFLFALGFLGLTAWVLERQGQ